MGGLFLRKYLRCLTIDKWWQPKVNLKVSIIIRLLNHTTFMNLKNTYVLKFAVRHHKCSLKLFLKSFTKKTISICIILVVSDKSQNIFKVRNCSYQQIFIPDQIKYLTKNRTNPGYLDQDVLSAIWSDLRKHYLYRIVRMLIILKSSCLQI